MLLPEEQEAKKSNNIERTVEREQIAFLPVRYILEGLVILHETIHELKRKKQNGLILKLDFEKACDKVNWTFSQQVMSGKWCRWIDKIVKGGCNTRKFHHNKILLATWFSFIF
jgi:hypothetical protein